MIRWEWEGNGHKKVIPGHLYYINAAARGSVEGCSIHLPSFGKTGEKNVDGKHLWTQISHSVDGMLYVL